MRSVRLFKGILFHGWCWNLYPCSLQYLNGPSNKLQGKVGALAKHIHDANLDYAFDKRPELNRVLLAQQALNLGRKCIPPSTQLK